MAGFVATDQVEELSYDFNPHVAESGTIPEPSSKAIEDYQRGIRLAMESAGVEVGEDGKARVTSERDEHGDPIKVDMDDLMDKSKEVETATMYATAELTGIKVSTLEALPFRVARAFLGWIMGQFFPEG